MISGTFLVGDELCQPETPQPSSPIPARAVRADIYRGLQELANIKVIYYIPPTIFVELGPAHDRVYGRHSLPGIVAGYRCRYADRTLRGYAKLEGRVPRLTITALHHF